MEPMNEPNNSTNLQQALTNMIVWFRYLLRRWWMFLIAGILGGCLGILFATIQKPKYESRLTFALEENSGSMGGAFSLAAQFGFNIGGGNGIFAGDNIVTILTSRRIIESVLLSVDTVGGQPITMANAYLKMSEVEKPVQLKKAKVKKADYPVGLPRDKFTYLQDSILYTLYNRIIKTELIAMRPDRKLNQFEVKFISLNERFSKIFTERLVSEAIEFYTELRSRRSKNTLDILEQRVSSLRGNARTAIQGRAGIQDANVNPVFAQQSAQLQQKQLDITAYGSAYTELFKNLELARYQYLQDIPLLQIIDKPEYPMKKIKDGRMKTGILWGLFFGLALFVFLIIYRISKIAFKGIDKAKISAMEKSI